MISAGENSGMLIGGYVLAGETKVENRQTLNLSAECLPVTTEDELSLIRAFLGIIAVKVQY
jgi:hypothetical protein